MFHYKYGGMRSGLWRISLLLLLIAGWTNGQDFDPFFENLQLNCDPCIDRKNYFIQAFYHGTDDDPFWDPVEAGATQAAADMRIDLFVQRYIEVDYQAMADDIRIAIDDPPDALIVTVPNDAVAQAVKEAVEAGIAVFGLNSGYKLAKSLGIKAFVSQDEELAGKEAGVETLRLLVDRNMTLQHALYVNHESSNTALIDRREAFENTILVGSEDATMEEFVIDDATTDDEIAAVVSDALQNCKYQVILLAGLKVYNFEDFATIPVACPKTILGTFDMSDNVFADMSDDRVSFAISQQPFLQGVLPVQLAGLYITTGMIPAPPIGDDEGLYLAGPTLITKENLPSNEDIICEDDGFPTCPNQNKLDGTVSSCDCTERSDIGIGVVTHRRASDEFWDPVAMGATQATKDLGIVLFYDEFEDQGVDDEDLYSRMAEQIRDLCKNENVYGMIVSIPNDSLLAAILECRDRGVPVVSMNSGAKFSRQLSLMHHVGQLEKEAGIMAGKRMVEVHGVAYGWCVNHEPLNDSIKERCEGFRIGLLDAGAVYLGQIEVPRDDDDTYKIQVESGVEGTSAPAGTSWAGHGLLLAGQLHLQPALTILDDHPEVIMGTFDVSEEIFDALDANQLVFAIDQQPYLQGYLSVSLLTHYIYSNNHVDNEFIESGPRFVVESPSLDETVCVENQYKVCTGLSSPTGNPPTTLPPPPTPLPTPPPNSTPLTAPPTTPPPTVQPVNLPTSIPFSATSSANAEDTRAILIGGVLGGLFGILLIVVIANFIRCEPAHTPAEPVTTSTGEAAMT